MLFVWGSLWLLESPHHEAPTTTPRTTTELCRQKLTLAAQFLQEAGAVGAMYGLVPRRPLLVLLLLLQCSSLGSGVFNSAEGLRRKL